MNIAHAMCFVIQRSHSLTEILEKAVELIAREMGTDVCSIYLIDPKDHRLRLMATQGLDKAALGKVTLALGEGLTGTVVKETSDVDAAFAGAAKTVTASYTYPFVMATYIFLADK